MKDPCTNVRGPLCLPHSHAGGLHGTQGGPFLSHSLWNPMEAQRRMRDVALRLLGGGGTMGFQ